MADPEPEHADAHEGIHLPPPSIWPVVSAIGIALLLTGLILTPITVIIGALITIVSIGAWIRDSRRELEELPE